MKRSAELITPRDEQHWLELRAEDLTSTESGALFGCSPYATYFEVWHRKKNRTIVQIEESTRMKWGKRLQDAIAAGIAEEKGWKVRRMNQYARDPEHRMGASFDFTVGKEGILEIKNVDALAFKEGWIIGADGELEAPPHIEIQIQHQLAVLKKKVGYIGALVGGNRVVIIEREPDPAIIDSIRAKSRELYASIEKGIEPAPNFEEDAAFICKLYSQAHAGKILDASRDTEFARLATEHSRLGELERETKALRDALKAQMLMKIGDAEKVISDGFSISAGTVAAAHVEYEREPYRNFRVYWKKTKAAV